MPKEFVDPLERRTSPGASWISAAILLSAFLAGPGVAAANVSGPVTVSPGDLSRIGVIDTPCPTFSFAGGAEAETYELVVYAVEEESEEPRTVLRRELPGSASSFTPALGECLETGEEYAWSVRSRSSHTSDWSRPRLFQVASRPGAEGLAATLDELLRRVARLEDAVRESTEARADVQQAAPDSATSPPSRQRVAGATGASLLTVNGGVGASYFVGDGSALSNLPPADDVVCSGCVSGGDVASRSIGYGDLADGAVGAWKLQRITGVIVECSGSCSDITLGQACDRAGSFPPWEPIAVDCRNTQEAGNGVTCGTNNSCIARSLYRGIALNNFCDDDSGGDAIVFCMEP